MFFQMEMSAAKIKTWKRVSGLPRNCREKIPWLFHDWITKFHDLLIDIHNSWISKSCRVAAPIHENREFVCKIPLFFHDFLLQFKNSMALSIFSQNSMTFPEIPENPWLFHDRGNPEFRSKLYVWLMLLACSVRKLSIVVEYRKFQWVTELLWT